MQKAFSLVASIELIDKDFGIFSGHKLIDSDLETKPLQMPIEKCNWFVKKILF